MTQATTNNPVYEAVPEAIPAQRRRGRSNELHDTLIKVMQQPNVEFRVGMYASKTGASSTLNAINKGRRTVPAGSFKYTARFDPETGGSKLYAVFLGAESAA